MAQRTAARLQGPAARLTPLREQDPRAPVAHEAHSTLIHLGTNLAGAGPGRAEPLATSQQPTAVEVTGPRCGSPPRAWQPRPDGTRHVRHLRPAMIICRLR